MAIHFLASPDDRALLGEVALQALADVYSTYLPPNDVYVEFSCVDKATIQGINTEYRQINEPTDVLSFPLYQPEDIGNLESEDGQILLGSIMICPEITLYYKETLVQVLHHGLLHVIGYDHETDQAEWERREQPILGKLAEHGYIIQPLGHEET